MAGEYQRRYGESWEWFTTLVNMEDYDPSLFSRRHSHVRMVYTGNLGLNRWQVLRNLAQAVEHIREQGDVPLELQVYAPEEQLRSWGSALGDSPSVTLKGWVSMEQLPRIFHESDILVHVESDDAQNLEYTRYSLSTKLSQYMMAGRCILGIGPDQVGSMQTIRQASAGIVIQNRHVLSDCGALRRMLTDAGAREELGRNGRRWATAHVSSQLKQPKFRRLLQTAAAGAPHGERIRGRYVQLPNTCRM